MLQRLGLIMLLCLAPVFALGAQEAQDDDAVLFSDGFEDGLDAWEFTDADAWEVTDIGGDKVLALTGQSDYEPEVRSPVNIAWVKDLDVGSFVMDVTARQTGKEYGHRDLCFFFNKQDPTHFYYVHLATAADDHANSIFLVDGSPRVSIAEQRTSGTDWGQEPHQIRIVRNAETGMIAVYYNNMKSPVMVAHDEHFTGGSIGLGSFDDTGWFDDITVRKLTAAEEAATE